MMTPTPPFDEDALAKAGTPEIHSALFLQLVAGHGQMALMFLGQIENPHTGVKEAPQIEAAKIFIDQLEMLVTKTRGNLDSGESKLLERTLAAVHRAFAEVLEAQVDSDPGTSAPG